MIAVQTGLSINPNEPTYWNNPANLADKFESGYGTVDEPYIIKTAAQLAFLAQQVNELGGTYTDMWFNLEADIDLSDHYWVPIGNDKYKFEGNFDGQNHTISGLYIGINGSATYKHTGLFGNVYRENNSVVIRNLILKDGSIIGGGTDNLCYTGALAGYVYNSGEGEGTIENCHNRNITVKGRETEKTNYTGGLIGYILGSVDIKNCYNNGSVTNVTQRSYTGGITGGGGTSMHISNCYNTGIISGGKESYSYTGGIVGYWVESGSNGSSTITDCYNTANVMGSDGSNSRTGGIVGCSFFTSFSVTISNCLVISPSVTGYSSYLHRIVGDKGNTTLINNYALADMVGGTWNSNSSGDDGADWGGLMDEDPIDKWSDAIWQIDLTHKIMPKLTTADLTTQTDISNPISISAGIGYWSDAKSDDAPKFASLDWYTENPEEANFTVSTAADLAGLAWLVNNGTQTFSGKTITLAENLDLSAHYWVPIGYSIANSFRGYFDGNNKTISGLIIGMEESDPVAYTYVGLFGFVHAKDNETAGIKNLTLGADNGSVIINLSEENSSITAALAGHLFVNTTSNTEGKIEILNCTNHIAVTGGNGNHSSTGGLIGRALLDIDNPKENLEQGNGELIISGCLNYAKVTVGKTTSGVSAGGIIAGITSTGYTTGEYASTNSFQITDCVNYGDITGSQTAENSYIGGITGSCTATTGGREPMGGEGPGESAGTITNCTNNGKIIGGTVTTNAFIAGIIGYAYATYQALGIGNASFTISNCKNNGIIEGATADTFSATGGIVGYGSSFSTHYKLEEEPGEEEGEEPGEEEGEEVIYTDHKGFSSFITINCTNSGAIAGGDSERSYTGGIVGHVLVSDSDKDKNEDSYGEWKISYCSNSANITGGTGSLHSGTGGIIGYGLASSYGLFSVTDCYSYSSLTSEDGFAGGLAGIMLTSWKASLRVASSYASGSITKTMCSGGLIGLVGARGNVYFEEGGTPWITAENNLVVMDELKGDESDNRIIGRSGILPSSTNIFENGYLCEYAWSNNYAYIKNDKSQRTVGHDTFDGANWNGELSGLYILLSEIGWSKNTWNLFNTGYLPQLKEASEIVHPLIPYTSGTTTEPIVQYTITLEVAPGITNLNHTPGQLIFTTGEHLYLNFSLENPAMTASNILFLVNGTEQPLNSTGNNSYSYIINPVNSDHTILIALKEYNVTLPEVDGVIFDFSPDENRIEYGKPFTFLVTLAKKINPALFRLFVNGLEIFPNPLRTTTLTYTIEKVTGPINITVEGAGDPVNNTSVENGIQIYGYGGQLVIETNSPQTVRVYNLTGRIITQRTLQVGTTKIPLAEGIYIVHVGNLAKSVMVK